MILIIQTNKAAKLNSISVKPVPAKTISAMVARMAGSIKLIIGIMVVNKKYSIMLKSKAVVTS
jgi:hypothetical protein